MALGYQLPIAIGMAVGRQTCRSQKPMASSLDAKSRVASILTQCWKKLTMETQAESILAGHTELEKGAYLAALASLATADRSATQEELDHLREMAEAADLSEKQIQFILHAANDISGEDLKKCLDILKNSDLKYSLISDMIALAKADGEYNEQEKANIEKVAAYLNVNQKQVSFLDDFVEKAAEQEIPPQEATQSGFLDSLGLKDKFSKAGFNTGSLSGLMGMLGPLVLGGIAARSLSGRGRRVGGGGMGGGLLGGVLGGMMGGTMGGLGGGLGGMLGGGGFGRMGGGLGSLIQGMNRSRSNRSMGGLLGRLL